MASTSAAAAAAGSYQEAVTAARRLGVDVPADVQVSQVTGPALAQVQELASTTSSSCDSRVSSSNSSTSSSSVAGAGAGAGAISPSAEPSPAHDAAAAAAAAAAGEATAKAASDHLPGFEGPEKMLEIDYARGHGDKRGARAITRDQWDSILGDAKCEIIATMANQHCDSYVLSESSLFVYTHKVIIKTCGTTTLLRLLDSLRAATLELGLVEDWVGYTRKDFMYPTDQHFPHGDFTQEIQYLQKRHAAGHGYILGPLTGDHWIVFVADYSEVAASEFNDRTLNIMMFDLQPAVAARFFRQNISDKAITDAAAAAAKPHAGIRRTNSASASECAVSVAMTDLTGIRSLLPGVAIQEHAFEPCGYSMNGLKHSSYYTIHVTPESHCSYASFETNVKQSSYSALVRNVLETFRPRRFTMTLFCDHGALPEMADSPIDGTYKKPSFGSYQLTSKSRTEFEGEYCAFMANFLRAEPASKGNAAKKAKANSAVSTVPHHQQQQRKARSGSLHEASSGSLRVST